jgi:hypothetical protein
VEALEIAFPMPFQKTEISQRREKESVPLRAEHVDQAALMSRRQRLGAQENCTSLRFELQSVATAVHGGSQPLDHPALLQPMQQPHQPRPLNSERHRQFRLGEPAIVVDHREHGKLCRTDFDGGQGPDEILEYPDLKAPDEIA